MKIPYLSGLRVSGEVELKNLQELNNATRFLTIDANNNVKWSVGSSGSGNVDLSNYFTKSQSDSRFQPIGNYLTSVNWSMINDRPTALSQFANDAGYITSFTEVDTLDSVLGRGNTSAKNITVTGKATFSNELIIPSSTSTSNNSIWLGTANSTGYTPSPSVGVLNDLLDVAITAPVNGQALVYNGFEWINQSVVTNLSDYYTKSQTDNLISGFLTSISWNDILNKPSIPTLVSQLINDSGYVTSSIVNGYATQTYVNNSIANLISSAPSTLDTLYELANALGNDANFSTTVTNLIGNKANASDVYNKSTSDGRYQPLENQRLSSGNNVSFSKVTAVNEMIIPSTASASNNSIWLGNANSSGNTPTPSANYLRDLLDVDFAALQNGQSIQFDSASGNWKNVSLQVAGNYATTDGANINVSSFRNYLGMKGNGDYHQYHTPFGTDANTVPEHTSSFTYAVNAPATGYLGYFGAGGYGLQLNADYGGGFGLHFRTHNGDAGQWNSWRRIWNSNDFTFTTAATGYSVVQRTAEGYVNATYFNMSAPTVDGTGLTDFVTTIGDGYLRRNSIGAVRTALGNYGNWAVGDWVSVVGLISNDPLQPYMRQTSTDNIINLVASASLGSLAYRNAIDGNEVYTNANYAGGDIGIAKLLRWKNYGNGHVIFDASNGTAPDGTAISNDDSTHQWSGSYPTLMGWNGAATYGIKVDTARFAHNATYATEWVAYDGSSTGNAITYTMGFDAGLGKWKPFSAPALATFLNETLDSVTIRSPYVRRDIRIVDAPDIGVRWAYNGDYANLYFNNPANGSGKLYLDIGDDGAWEQGFSIRGTKYDGSITNVAYFSSNSSIELYGKTVFLGGSNGAETYNGGIEVRGTNAGITLHYPGYHARSLYMDSNGTLNWAGVGFSTNWIYTSSTVDAGNFVRGQRLIAGYDSGVAGSVNASNWFRSEGNSGWFSASHGGGIWMTDDYWLRVYNGKALLVENRIHSTTQVDSPTMIATSKMVIPTSAPASPENGCIWIS